ncbi:MAG: hypothetical protein R3F56_26305 [Planctomycetota bacterium]
MPGTPTPGAADAALPATTYRGERPPPRGTRAEYAFGIRLKRRVRDARRWAYANLARASVWALMRLPFTWVRGLCRVLVVGVASRLHGRVAEQHLMMAFGGAMSPDDRRRTLRAMFRGMADLPAEVLAAVHRGPDFIRSRFLPSEDLDKWHRLQAEAGALVAITGHIGNWEMLVQYLVLESRRPVGGVVAKRIPNPRLNRLVESMRGKFGVRTLYRDTDGKQMARLLARGHSIGLVPDQDSARLPGTFVPVFGRPAYTPTGPARLALTTGKPIVCVYALRQGDRFRLLVDDPIHPDRSAPREAEIVRLTQAWSDRMEEVIRAHPEQWMWLHNRWRSTPETLAARRIATRARGPA